MYNPEKITAELAALEPYAHVSVDADNRENLITDYPAVVWTRRTPENATLRVMVTVEAETVYVGADLDHPDDLSASGAYSYAEQLDQSATPEAIAHAMRRVCRAALAE